MTQLLPGPSRAESRAARAAIWRGVSDALTEGVRCGAWSSARTSTSTWISLHEAAHELGTQRTTDTVHQALREVVARARRARLAERDFEDLTPDALEAMRRPAGRTA